MPEWVTLMTLYGHGGSGSKPGQDQKMPKIMKSGQPKRSCSKNHFLPNCNTSKLLFPNEKLKSSNPKWGIYVFERVTRITNCLENQSLTWNLCLKETMPWWRFHQSISWESRSLPKGHWGCKVCFGSHFHHHITSPGLYEGKSNSSLVLIF